MFDMKELFRIALVFDQRTMDEWRAYFMSAHRFARTQPDWRILREGGYTCFDWNHALALEPDGILGTLEFDRPVPLPRSDRTQVVIVNTTIAQHPFHRVIIDEVEVGRRAADHLIARSLSHYAYAGWSTLGFSEDRQRGFRTAIENAGLASAMALFNLVTPDGELFVPPDEWFASLRKPCGIFCANDGLGVRMIEAALAIGYAVPGDIAIMGAGDDEIQCAQSPVPMTSVTRDLVAQGYSAAQHLDRWLRDKRPAAQTVVHPPGEVVERQSTLVFGEADPIVRRALTLIHTPSSNPMTVDRLLSLLGQVSRRRLEMLFKQRLGHTPYHEILRARIALTKRLLRSTTLSIDEIAFQAGFSSCAHISRPFKAHTGQTPTEYRRQHSAGPPNNHL